MRWKTKYENLQSMEGDVSSTHANAKLFITPSHRFVFLPENGGLSEVNIFKGIMNLDCPGRTS